ncbi:hypothetical protein AX15_000871 [Amanita polypyramis BW_CC]|nr:hypothetical protein AX15_000871 [Amanita polypyramis BW_CC]
MSNLFSPREKLAIVWDRITFSRVTIIYLCFTVLYFMAQLALQGQALRINIHAVDNLTGLISNRTSLRNGLPVMQGSTLKICTWLPASLRTDDSACSVIWNDVAAARISSNSSDSSGLSDNSKSLSGIKSTPSTTIRVTTTATSVHSSSTTTITSSWLPPPPTKSPSPLPPHSDMVQQNRTISASNVTHQRRELSVTIVPDNLCQTSLIWPISELRDSEREDIVFMVFQSWVLGVSIVALLNESIPHIIASLITHLLTTAWAGVRILNTAVFRSKFGRVIVHGTCSGMDVLPDYWDTRCKAELAALILNIVSLVISSFLTWRITKSFGWQTFKRVGASLVISRVYRLVLLLSIAIQLSLFFMATTVSLWIDRLVNSAIGDLDGSRVLYLVSSGTTLALLIPWLAMGWFGARRELRLPMLFFLLLSLLYLGGWGIMFFSTTFRWTFLTWHLFSVMACASVFLTCTTFVLGIICRYNFGKGLRRHLNNSLSESEEGSRSVDIEKVDFPSDETMFSQHFVTSPASMHALGRFVSPPNTKSFVIPALASDFPTSHTAQWHKGHSSDSSCSSDGSTSHSCILTSVNSKSERGKRWIIE